MEGVMGKKAANEIGTILVGTSLGLESVGGVELAKLIVDATGASLHAVTVIQPMSVQQEAAAPGLAEKHMAQAQEELGRFADSHGLAGRVDLHVVKGAPEEELLKLGRRLKADLLVVGRYGRGGLKHGLLGSVADRIARKSPCDVLLAEPEFRGRVEVVGVASDLSAESEVALSRALRLGSMFGAREVVFLHAYELPVGYHMVMTEQEVRARLEEVSRREAEAIVERARGKTDGPPVRIVLGEGVPATRVPELAREQGVQLLVMSTHDRTRPAMMFLGRVTEKIVRNATCSVWLEKDPAWHQNILGALKELVS